MQVFLLKSKIHRATVTDGNVDYEGSLTIAADLMKAAGLYPYERILCSNLANGNRFETYVITGKRGSGEIVLNGAAAHLGKKGTAHHHELRRHKQKEGGEVETAGYRTRTGKPDRNQARDLIHVGVHASACSRTA